MTVGEGKDLWNLTTHTSNMIEALKRRKRRHLMERAEGNQEDSYPSTCTRDTDIVGERMVSIFKDCKDNYEDPPFI